MLTPKISPIWELSRSKWKSWNSMERNPNCTSRRRLWINLKMQNWKLKWRVKWRESDQLNFKSFFNQAFYNSILKMKCYNMMKLFRINQLNHWEINTLRRNTSLVCWQLCIAHFLTHPNTNVFFITHIELFAPFSKWGVNPDSVKNKRARGHDCLPLEWLPF